MHLQYLHGIRAKFIKIYSDLIQSVCYVYNRYTLDGDEGIDMNLKDWDIWLINVNWAN